MLVLYLKKIQTLVSFSKRSRDNVKMTKITLWWNRWANRLLDWPLYKEAHDTILAMGLTLLLLAWVAVW